MLLISSRLDNLASKWKNHYTQPIPRLRATTSAVKVDTILFAFGSLQSPKAADVDEEWGCQLLKLVKQHGIPTKEDGYVFCPRCLCYDKRHEVAECLAMPPGFLFRHVDGEVLVGDSWVQRTLQFYAVLPDNREKIGYISAALKILAIFVPGLDYFLSQ